MRRQLQQASGSQVAVNLIGGEAVSGQVDHVDRGAVVLVDVKTIVGGSWVEVPGRVAVPLARISWVQVT